MQEHGAPSWDRQQGFHRVSEPAAILRACARERVATTVQLGHTDAEGHFTRMLADGIEIELDAPIPQGSPTIQGWCGVLFHHAGRACMLIGAVEPGGSPRSLKVLRPFSMQIQRRANPRIAVAHEALDVFLDAGHALCFRVRRSRQSRKAFVHSAHHLHFGRAHVVIP